MTDDADADREAADHPIDPNRARDVARRCRQLAADAGRDPVRGHTVTYTPRVWTDLLAALPPAARAGAVTRGDVFDIADEVASGQRPARDLFTASYIWGQGNTGYGRSRYDRIVSANGERLDQCLDRALAQTRGNVIGAYASLYGGYAHDGGEPRAPAGDSRWSRISGYGPAFFTKLLYFACGGALILDKRLATQVHDLSGLLHFIDSRGAACAWSPYRYAVYVAWMNQTAATLTLSRPLTSITPALLELALFTNAPSDDDEPADFE